MTDNEKSATMAPITNLTPTAYLVVLKGSSPGYKFLLNKERTIIGRSNEADLHLAQVSVSKTHAVIERIAEKFIIIDNNSTNGTWVNSIKIEKQMLKDQDTIRIGETQLKFIFSDNPEQTVCLSHQHFSAEDYGRHFFDEF
jgi:pSer/pThr/pTyr-binding forkhead associated (FHA) protein